MRAGCNAATDANTFIQGNKQSPIFTHSGSSRAHLVYHTTSRCPPLVYPNLVALKLTSDWWSVTPHHTATSYVVFKLTLLILTTNILKNRKVIVIEYTYF
jgi:hypothetical protein